jgi:hypothetical protein
MAGHSRESIIDGFNALRTVTDRRGHDLLAVLEEEALWLHQSLCNVVGIGDERFSVKVADTPALRLVGGYACDPDESCGQAS